MPADSPTTAIVSGHGLALRLEQSGNRERSNERPEAVTLRLLCEGEPACDATGARQMDAVRIEFAQASPAIELPSVQQQFVLTRAHEQPWHVGRAGLSYRDLIPGRLGGRFIA